MAGSWTTSANTPPDDVATMLPLTDGTVMARGYGTSAWYRLTPSAMSYANGTWSTLASSTEAPLYYAPGVLRDRRVIYSGGEYDSFSMVFLATSEIYDLIANTWTVILPLCLRLRRGCDMRGEGRDGLGTRGRGARAPRARRALMSTTRPAAGAET